MPRRWPDRAAPGGEPVLAVAAVEIAAQHAEGQRVGAGQHVEEGLFLDRVALQAGHVAPGHAQLAVLVEAHLADAAPPGADQAAVPAGQAAHRPSGRLSTSEPGTVRPSRASATVDILPPPRLYQARLRPPGK